MVDGIVPNNNKQSEYFNLPYNDNSIVVTEPYRDWYIQSNNNELKNILSNNKIKFVCNGFTYFLFFRNIKNPNPIIPKIPKINTKNIIFW